MQAIFLVDEEPETPVQNHFSKADSAVPPLQGISMKDDLKLANTTVGDSVNELPHSSVGEPTYIRLPGWSTRQPV